MRVKFEKMLRQRISNLIQYIFRSEPIQTQKNPMPHAKDLTYQSILSILAEKVEYQFLQYWQLNQSVLLVFSIVVLVFILKGIKWFNGSELRNTWTLINLPNSWFNISKTQHPLSVLNVPTYIESNFSQQDEMLEKDFPKKTSQKTQETKMEYNSDKKPLHEYTKMKGMTFVIVCLVSEKRPTFNTVYRKTNTIPIVK
ncbi:hypothetical protein BpHYR1_020633 [Brachionus plicatilis]|uniref:Uncharacterized protein n=1 Tax=Brachionus plicatilis TaxID=10195 RepID=A0A3M7SBL9_BRAPC|nr:hypothetical protein BpHYR1_020633 [Brachionus plicatilis]